jgi:hypothetical protein
MRTKKVPIEEIMMQLPGDLGAPLVLLPQTRTLNGRISMLLCRRNPLCGALHNVAICTPKSAHK